MQQQQPLSIRRLPSHISGPVPCPSSSRPFAYLAHLSSLGTVPDRSILSIVSSSFIDRPFYRLIAHLPRAFNAVTALSDPPQMTGSILYYLVPIHRLLPKIFVLISHYPSSSILCLDCYRILLLQYYECISYSTFVPIRISYCIYKLYS
uniref:Uncharacterized protein n=1 Tax=Pristionchus pacificus TaxID=54126 RepID=A0A2A6BEK1_PRIPA